MPGMTGYFCIVHFNWYLTLYCDMGVMLIVFLKVFVCTGVFDCMYGYFILMFGNEFSQVFVTLLFAFCFTIFAELFYITAVRNTENDDRMGVKFRYLDYWKYEFERN